MANTVKYYPLLKKGFQEIADTDNIDAEIATLQKSVNDLQAGKVSKALTAADLNNITDTEIFQWQGDDTTIDDNSFKHGFFYQQTSKKIIIPKGTNYLYYSPIYPTITENNYIFAPGGYYFIEELTPASGNFFNYYYRFWQDKPQYIFLYDGIIPVADVILWDTNNYSYVRIVYYSQNVATLDNGDTINTTNGVQYQATNLYRIVNLNGDEFALMQFDSFHYVVLHYTLNNNVFNEIDFFVVNLSSLTTNIDTIIGADVYSQTNTQPTQTDGSNLKVNFTPSSSVIRENIESGDLLSTIAAKISNWFELLPKYFFFARPSESIASNTAFGLFKIDTNVFNIQIAIMGGWQSGTLGQLTIMFIGRYSLTRKIAVIGPNITNAQTEFIAAEFDNSQYIYVKYNGNYSSNCTFIVTGINSNYVTPLNFAIVNENNMANPISITVTS